MRVNFKFVFSEVLIKKLWENSKEIKKNGKKNYFFNGRYKKKPNQV